MKIKIWEKDDFFDFIRGPRVEMDPRVVTFGEEPMALMWNYDIAGEVYGTVKDVRLEDGEIVGEVAFTNQEFEENVLKLLEHKDVRFGGYYNEVARRRSPEGGDVEIVTSCVLKAVSVVMAYNMPGAEIRKEAGDGQVPEAEQAILDSVDSPSEEAAEG